MCPMNKLLLLPVFAFLAAVAVAQQADQVGASPGPGVRYATDAYPGFDTEGSAFGPERKEPRWFGFINGPKCGNAADQFVYCQSLDAEGRLSKAAKEYDALVREWPTSEEAPKAQLRLAEIRLEEDELDEALSEYQYLADFYSFRCDYNATVDKMYEIAGRMRVEGKTIVFFRFRNTVEVRRAYEGCVLRAPGAKWAPAALLAVGELREEEEKLEAAVKVYENLRNLHYGSPEARAALIREAEVRMRILDECGYNRARCLDTLRFLDMAADLVDGDDATALVEKRDAVRGRLEDEAYRAACFYDSRMRTKRSAVNAYERFLAEFPESPRAEEIRTRLNELKGAE